MRIIRGVLGVLIILIGALWIGQGLGYIGQNGSGMTGQPQWAIIGLVCIVIGLWLLSTVRSRRLGGSRR
jgi:hypothetical protein